MQGAHTLRVEENRSTSAALITRPDSNSLSTRSSSLWVVFAELDASCSIACVARVTRHLSFDLAKNWISFPRGERRISHRQIKVQSLYFCNAYRCRKIDNGYNLNIKFYYLLPITIDIIVSYLTLVLWKKKIKDFILRRVILVLYYIIVYSWKILSIKLLTYMLDNVSYISLKFYFLRLYRSFWKKKIDNIRIVRTFKQPKKWNHSDRMIETV